MAVKVQYSKKFLKNFKKRIIPNKNLSQQFNERVELFSEDSKHPLLKDHKLTGTKKKYRAFSITGDVRVVYEEVSEDEVLLLDIGTHNQVY